MLFNTTVTECCGLGGIHGFSGPRDYIEQELRERIEDHVGANKGRILVTLSEQQYEHWEPLIKHYGFRKVDAFRNPNSGNNVRIYLLKCNSSRFQLPKPKFCTI